MGEVTSIQIMGNTMSEPSDDPTCEINRRNCLGATGAALLGVTGLSALSKMALAASPAESEDDEILYGHGMVWNRQLPGVAGALNLSFDMRVNLDTGLGAGSAHDPVHPEWNFHFAIASTETKQVRGVSINSSCVAR